MAIQYYMRGYDAITQTDVDWVVNDTPDTSGTYSGSINPLINIRINRTVQSPVNTIIKSSLPSFVGNQIPAANQYFFYLNGYDWIHPDNPTLPVPVPAPTVGVPYGIAVMRGTTDTANPPTSRDFAAMYWKEGSSPSAGQWNLNYINSLGAPVAYTALAIGTSVPTSGIIRLPNNEFIKSLDLIGGATIPIIGVNTNDRVEVGSSSYGVYMPADLLVDDYLSLVNGGASVASSGLIRTPNNTTALSFLNNAALANLDAVSSTSSDEIVIGESVNNQGIIYKVGNTSSSHTFEINSSPILSIFKDNINGDSITFDKDSYNPTIKQTAQNVGNGKPITIEAQSSSDPGGNGGDVILSAGSGLTSGYVDLRIAGVPKFRVNDTTLISYNDLFQFERTLASVEIEQEAVSNAFGAASNFTISAQDNNGLGGTAGDLILTSGVGLGTNGRLYLQNGGTNQLEVRADAIRIFTNRLNFDENITVPYDPIEFGQDPINLPGSAGTDLKIFAQSNNAVASTGAGDLYLTSGNSGSGNHGNLVLQVGNSDRATLSLNGCSFDLPVFCNFYIGSPSALTAQVLVDKFVTNKGRRRSITDADDTTYPAGYTVVAGDDVISVTSIAAAFSVYLPASPVTGDTYTIKDSGGNAGTWTITVDAGLNTIDGVATYPMSTNYESFDVIYNGTEWSAI
jgi:hypothetical protein